MPILENPLWALLIGVMLGALVAIPIGFWVNIKTPDVARYFEDQGQKRAQQRALRSKVSAEMRKRSLARELALVKAHHDNRGKLYSRMVYLARDVAGTIITVLLTFVLYMIAHAIPDKLPDETPMLLTGMLVVLFVQIFLLSKRVTSDLRLLESVVRYDDYEEAMLSQMMELTALVDGVSLVPDKSLPDRDSQP